MSNNMIIVWPPCCKQLWDCKNVANCSKNCIFDPWKLAYQIPLSTNIWTCWSKMVSWLVTLNICVYSIIKVLTFLERIVACQADWGYQISFLSDCALDRLILFSVLADWPAWKYLEKVYTCRASHVVVWPCYCLYRRPFEAELSGLSKYHKQTN